MKEFERMLSKTQLAHKPARVHANLEPHFWVDPHYVIEIRADEITQSPLHTCAKKELGQGLALRFPRFVQMRSDKKPEEATTTQEIIALYNMQKKVAVETQETEA
jgi:DNA ligase-1